jgi:hypothetical protein
MSQPKFTGVWIPVEVFQMETLTITEKVVYGIVNALDNEEGCFASNGYLAQTLQLSERQVKNVLKTLIDYKLVVRVELNGRRLLRTVEKQALVGATDFLGRGKSISPRGGSKLPTYNKEDNKEDIKKDEPVVLPYGSDFKVSWDRWEAYRKQTKKPLTAMTRVEQVKLLGDLQNEKQAIATIDKSIAFGWQGLFVTKQDNQKYKAPLTNQDHANGF